MIVQVPALLSAPGLVPLPASVLASHDWNGFARHPIGNGPFRLENGWLPGTGGKLVRVTPALGKANEADLRVGDPVQQYDEVRDGSLDLVTSVPGERHEAMHADFADRHTTWPLPEAGYLVFPVRTPRFGDATVRHAFALAANREALVEGPLAHQVDPPRALLPPAEAPGERAGTCRPCSFDAAAAKSLLGQSGFTGPATVYFDTGAGSWTSSLAAGLSGALGVPVTARQKPSDGPLNSPSTVDPEGGHPEPGRAAHGSDHRFGVFGRWIRAEPRGRRVRRDARGSRAALPRRGEPAAARPARRPALDRPRPRRLVAARARRHRDAVRGRRSGRSRRLSPHTVACSASTSTKPEVSGSGPGRV